MPGRHDRKRRPGRHLPSREPRGRLLIVCEGGKTEPEYIEGFRKSHRVPAGLVNVVRHNGGSPLSIVEHAIELKEGARRDARRQGDPTLDYGGVWCVYDVDDHDANTCRQAMDKARGKGVRVAVSNPSFELWLYLHFADPPGMRPRDWLRGQISKRVGKYGKAVGYDRWYAAGYPEAAARARQLDDAAERDGEPGRNPTTGVHGLMRAIEGSSPP
jgi:hypothetical protein